MLKPQIAKRLQHIKSSPTLEINSRASDLISQGKDIISMGVGEPDFSTPLHICDAAIQAIKNGDTRYTAISGTAEIKKAVRDKFARDNNLQFTHNEILVSTGAKQCLFNLFQALINPGDEVIIPAPYWVSYPAMTSLAEGTAVVIKAKMSNNLKITPEQLEKAITPKTKLFILNSPSNPTGINYTENELKALADVLLQHPHILIATDDIYEHILWGTEKFSNILMVCPKLKSRTIVFNGVSKAYAMTGWRIGYAGGPEWLIKKMTQIQSQSTSNPCSISQVAATAALNGPYSSIKKMIQHFKSRNEYVMSCLNTINNIKFLESQGTFYCFPDFNAVIKQKHLKNDVELSQQLLNEGIAVVPGSAFGAEGHLRLSYALSDDKLQTAMNRLTNYCIKK